jgi:hypothetical protein
MRLTPSQTPSSSSPVSTVAATDRGLDQPSPEKETWRWAVLHFPCLEPVTPQGHIVMVSDKEHIAEARRKFPDLVVWHEKELALFGEQMDRYGLDEETFAKVNLLKLKTRGWFMGAEDGEPAVDGASVKGSE